MKGKRAEQDNTECLSSKRESHMHMSCAIQRSHSRVQERLRCEFTEYASSENVAIAIAVMRMDTNVLTATAGNSYNHVALGERSADYYEATEQSPSILAPAERFATMHTKFLAMPVKVFGSRSSSNAFEETPARVSVQKSHGNFVEYATGSCYEHGTAIEMQ